MLIAIPILIQVYFNSSLAFGLMRLLRVEVPLTYVPGCAPRRPVVRTKQKTRIYVFAGRPAVAVR